MKRSVLVAQLEEQVGYLLGLIAGLDEQQLSRSPAARKMSLKQTAAHLAHTNAAFSERLDRMLNLDQPPVSIIDATLEDLESYKQIDLERAMDSFVRARKRLTERLARLYPQDWERRASHPEYQNYNVQMAVEHLLLHEAHHLYQMEQIRAAIDRWDQR